MARLTGLRSSLIRVVLQSNKKTSLSLTLTARARACEYQAWRGGRHFLEAVCLPLLNLSIKLVCVFRHSRQFPAKKLLCHFDSDSEFQVTIPLPRPSLATSMIQVSVKIYTSGILYPWYMAVPGGMYWYEPVLSIWKVALF